MPVYELEGVVPVVDPSAFVHPTAVLIGEGALVGMNAVVMDGARVGERAFVGAHSFVRAGFEVPPQSLAVGNPARVTRDLTEAELAWKANGTLTHQDLARRYRSSHRETQPLAQAEPDRPRLSVDRGTAVPLDEHRRKS